MSHIDESIALERPLIEAEIKTCLREQFKIDPAKVSFREDDFAVYGVVHLPSGSTIVAYKEPVHFKIEILDSNEAIVAIAYNKSLSVAIALAKQQMQQRLSKLQEILR